MTSSSKNWCIKEIHGHFYIYTWCYRPKAYHTNKKNQRFSWKYIGKYGGHKANKFFRKLSSEEQNKAHHTFVTLAIQKKQRDEYMHQLESMDPYKTEKEAITGIRNRYHREQRLKSFIRKLRLEANRQISSIQLEIE